MNNTFDSTLFPTLLFNIFTLFCANHLLIVWYRVYTTKRCIIKYSGGFTSRVGVVIDVFDGPAAPPEKDTRDEIDGAVKD